MGIDDIAEPGLESYDKLESTGDLKVKTKLVTDFFRENRLLYDEIIEKINIFTRKCDK